MLSSLQAWDDWGLGTLRSVNGWGYFISTDNRVIIMQPLPL